MLTLERQQEILSLIKQRKSVSVAELSKRFFIGEASIRRDLDKLEKKGLVKRTYGGAVLVSGLDSEIPLFIREEEQRGAKQLIGQLAASLVEDDQIIFMDSSSTVLSMAPYLKGRQRLTVITNGAKAAVALASNCTSACTAPAAGCGRTPYPTSARWPAARWRCSTRTGCSSPAAPSPWSAASPTSTRRRPSCAA